VEKKKSEEGRIRTNDREDGKAGRKETWIRSGNKEGEKEETHERIHSRRKGRR
jgi:hypothetical protein